jgi:predicted cobalt transporter CbtA
LPAPPAKALPERAFGYWFTVIACCIAGIPLYLFRKNIFFLFEGISVYFIYVIAGAALPVVVLRFLSMYRKFQKQMNSLNVY